MAVFTNILLYNMHKMDMQPYEVYKVVCYIKFESD